MKKALIIVGSVIVAGFVLLSIFERTTTDLRVAESRMSASERAYLYDRLGRIRSGTSRQELVQLLGPPKLETSFGIEWKGPTFPGRVRVYLDDDGRRVNSVSWLKIGWFDIRFRPGQLSARRPR